MKRPFKVCSKCNAHLDYGERCDCEKRNELTAKNLNEFYVKEKGSEQFCFRSNSYDTQKES